MADKETINKNAGNITGSYVEKGYRPLKEGYQPTDCAPSTNPPTGGSALSGDGSPSQPSSQPGSSDSSTSGSTAKPSSTTPK